MVARKTQNNERLEWKRPEEIDSFRQYLDQIVANNVQAASAAEAAQQSELRTQIMAEQTAGNIQGFLNYIENKFYQCTEEEYNNLSTIDPNTIYIIVDGEREDVEV